MINDRDPFIHDSIRKDWSGEPIEYEKVELPAAAAPPPRPTFTRPHGIVVEEITMEEWVNEYNSFKEKLRAKQS